MIKNKYFQYFAIGSFLFMPYLVSADCGCTQDSQNLGYNVQVEQYKMDQATATKGYTFSGFSSIFLVGISSNAIIEQSNIVLKKIHDPSTTYPENQTMITDIFEYDIMNKDTYNSKRPVFLKISYQGTDAHLKKIMYYDKMKSSWIEVPSKNDIENKIIRTYIHLPYARLAVFEDNNILETGTASWYRYKGGFFAASPDYPKGTKLRVTNIGENSPNKGKTVIVEVNDYGPDRTTHPERIIDLDLVAFKEIGNYRGGTIEVQVEKVQ